MGRISRRACWSVQITLASIILLETKSGEAEKCKDLFFKKEWMYKKDGNNAWISSHDDMPWDSDGAKIYYECRGEGDNQSIQSTKCRFDRHWHGDPEPLLCPGTFYNIQRGKMWKTGRVYVCWKEEKDGHIHLHTADVLKKKWDKKKDEFMKKYNNPVEQKDVEGKCTPEQAQPQAQHKQ